jgi:ADP-ribosylglycohydrolase
MPKELRKTKLYDKILGSLLGGLIGDAIGSSSEGLHYKTIEERYGWLADFGTEGTDDTIMKTLLAQALLETNGHAGRDDWAAQWMEDYETIFGKKADKFFISVHHTAVKLRFTLPRLAALGNLPSSSSAMCISPVGMVNPCNPAHAALQAYNVASLIHTHDVAFCQDGAAAVAAAVAEAMNPAASVESVLCASVDYIDKKSGEEMLDLISLFLSDAKSSGSYLSFRERVYKNSDRYFKPLACDSRETVPLALALFALADGELEQSILYGANFGRDADTIATMSGAIAGALHGAERIKKEWREKTRSICSIDQEELAEKLTRAAIKKHKSEMRFHHSVQKLL